MAFHYSRFGQFGEDLKRLADLHGMVPQKGDAPEDFAWPWDDFEQDFGASGEGHEGYAQDQWDDHLADCIAATEQAQRELDEWREENV